MIFLFSIFLLEPTPAPDVQNGMDRANEGNKMFTI